VENPWFPLENALGGAWLEAGFPHSAMAPALSNGAVAVPSQEAVGIFHRDSGIILW